MFSFTLNLAESGTALTQVLDSVWRNLSPGGSWILDFLTPRQRVTPQRDRVGAPARVLSQKQSYGRLCLEIGVRGLELNAWQKEQHCARLISPLKLRDDLDSRGFALTGAFDHATLGPAQHGSTAMVFVVHKPRVTQG
jgi:hypothetical protein